MFSKTLLTEISLKDITFQQFIELPENRNIPSYELADEYEKIISNKR